ncbi:hypothetical protein HJG60_008428 [Phyllostomus discolor]|uniref:Uncharacterized protein n=1 Tax=Phyllostomus discolor TaxID=89673 RepID=A0A833Z475_9CHIR|nr:hypothetical protein HJG60_008428 [Phyllostomus discolor]
MPLQALLSLLSKESFYWCLPNVICKLRVPKCSVKVCCPCRLGWLHGDPPWRGLQGPGSTPLVRQTWTSSCLGLGGQSWALYPFQKLRGTCGREHLALVGGRDGRPALLCRSGAGTLRPESACCLRGVLVLGAESGISGVCPGEPFSVVRSRPQAWLWESFLVPAQRLQVAAPLLAWPRGCRRGVLSVREEWGEQTQESHTWVGSVFQGALTGRTRWRSC